MNELIFAALTAAAAAATGALVTLTILREHWGDSRVLRLENQGYRRLSTAAKTQATLGRLPDSIVYTESWLRGRALSRWETSDGSWFMEIVR